MKKMSCSDLGGMDCDFVAEGETTQEVKNKMYEHAAKNHADKLSQMTEEQKAQADKKMDEILDAQ